MTTPTADLVLPATVDRGEWLAARRNGITATDVVKIVGLSQYGNALDVYLDKRIDPRDDTAPSEAARWGQLLEDQVAREWARRHDRRVRRVGLLARKDAPHHLASCDRRVVGEAAALEVKTRTGWAAAEWDHGAIPERVTVQAQWQMHVAGFRRVHVAALIGGQELLSTVVDRDEVLIAYLAAEADKVWSAVEAGEMPDVPPWQATAESLNRAWPDRAGAVPLEPSDADRARALVAEYREAWWTEKDAKRAKDEAKVALIALLGGGDEAVADGETLYTYRLTSPPTTITADNARQLLDDHPELADYFTTKPGTPRFALRPTRKGTR